MVRLDDAGAARLAASEGLAPLHPEHGTKPAALYRNLARFERSFVAGSVAAEADGVVDCVAGATVTLERDGSVVASATTDPFGDFRLDGLAPRSGRYRLVIAGPGGRGLTLEVEVVDSVSLGTLPI